MKKTLVSALTTALVVGAASTTFAAANPFSDVPSDHWAYDAVTQLAADGVIEGYGDTSFKGDKNITRYEMAQMVAKAMAKSNVGGADKALIEKLAAEFADELNNLGVRVANLERNADMVKWNGTAEYTFTRNNVDHQSGDKDGRKNNVLFRLEPSAEINNNWHVNARLDANTNLKKDEGDNGNVELKRVWAQGDYSNFQVKLGKFAPIDDDSIFDTTFSGAQVSAGKDIKLTIGAGRMNESGAFGLEQDDFPAGTTFADTANYQYAGLDYSKSKLALGVSYHHLNSADIRLIDEYKYDDSTSDEANIWMVKAGYAFSKNVALGGFYANNHDADNLNKSYSAELTYKGAEAENKGTWGTWVAYRYLGDDATPFSTFDAILTGQKGVEFGANYTPFKNIVATVRYGFGEELTAENGTHRDVSNIFGRVNFFF